ncbi:alpha/beta fold hydrolase [Pectobacterium carotovorum]|uniref:alpha/beta fold hydrolase n=1 Tax=Pectobacterium carotovorum TaxID=554 RepID=UPI001C641F6A|nr:alpha/beta hydrolase [Pectobacterium carotovorum]
MWFPKKIARPTLVVSGEHSNWVESQRWIAETVPDGQMIVYGKNENRDHFLHLKEPPKFSEQLKTFLQK